MSAMTIKARKAQVWDVVKRAFPEYRGRTFNIEFATSVTFHDLNWGGGTKSEYVAVAANGKTLSVGAGYAPWANPVEGKTVQIPQNVLIIKRSIFCGHNMGIRIYSHPANMPRWLPEGK